MCRLFPLLRKRILNNQKTKMEDYKKHSYYFILANHEFREEILNFKSRYANKETMIWHLTLLSNLLAFAKDHILPYIKEIHAIIVYSLLHKEKEINEKGAHLIKIILFSLIDTYPVDLQSYPLKMKDKDGNPCSIYSNIGDFKSKDFKMTWHQSTKEQRKLAFRILEIYFYPTLKNINQIINDVMPELVDQDLTPEYVNAHFRKNTKKYFDAIIFQEPKHQKELRVKIDMDVQLISGIFYAVSQKAGLMNEMTLIDKHFNRRYAIPEFSTIRKDLLKTIVKTLIFLFKTTLIKDIKIVIRVINILKVYLGDDGFNKTYLKF